MMLKGIISLTGLSGGFRELSSVGVKEPPCNELDEAMAQGLDCMLCHTGSNSDEVLQNFFFTNSLCKGGEGVLTE